MHLRALLILALLATPQLAHALVVDRALDLPRFYGSSYFDQIYWRARTRTPLPPADSLFHDLERLGNRPFERALIADTYLYLLESERSRNTSDRSLEGAPFFRPSLVDSLRPYLREEPGPEVLSNYSLGSMRVIR